jgi:hypothetical protein
LGPRIDPHFDAAVGRLVIDPTSSRWPTLAPGEGNVSNEQAKLATGYIELVGTRPYDSFIALLAAIFDPAGRSMPWVQRWTFRLGMHDRPHVWTQIAALRYLTTDEVTGVAPLRIIPTGLATARHNCKAPSNVSIKSPKISSDRQR